MRSIVRLLLCVCALMGTSAVPVGAAAPYGWVRSDGRPVAWNNSQPIPYSVDPGPLGSLSNANAVALLQMAFDRWHAVDTASISFAAAAPLPQHITGANVMAFLNSLPAGTNPVIFDSDGSVMRTLLGDPTAAVALGRPLAVDPASGAITSGFLVLNGLYIDGRFNPDDLSPADYRGMVVQEIGHFLGLGYSQLNTALILDGIPDNNSLIPQMYPMPVPENGDQLTVDDRAAIAALYPNPNSAATGTIRGQVLLPDGTTGLQGINVIARRVGDPLVTAVSAISGMRYKNEIGPSGLDGSRQVALRGAYELTGLPPGSYTLSFEALLPGSMAGPLKRPAFLPGGTQYFRAGSPSTTDPNAASQIPIVAGQVVENVNLVANGPASPPEPTINSQEPNEFPEQAQTLSLPVRVLGSIKQGDASGVSVPLPGGGSAAVQDLFRLTLVQPTVLTATLSAATAGSDLNLFLLSGPVATAPQVVAMSTDPGTPPESFQLRVPAGVYFLAVSLASGPGTAYTLEVNGTPAPDPATPAPPRPRLNNLRVVNVTEAGADTVFLSDLPSNTLLYVSNPLTEFSNPTLTTEHHQAVSNLAPGTAYRLKALAVTPALGIGTLPDFFFTTSLPPLAGGVGQISAGIADIIADPDDPNAAFVVLSFRNVGTGDAGGVTITTLSAPAGWTFTSPLPLPLGLGGVNRGGSGIIMTRLQHTGPPDGSAPIISGTGTYNSAGVGQQSFSFGGVVPTLILAKSVDPATARPGDIVTFTLTATNNGLGASTGVVISDALPPGMGFINSTPVVQPQNGTVSWSIGSLAPGASRTVSFHAQVPGNAADGSTITNVALLRSNEIPSPIASNVVPLAVSAPAPPQLQISKQADRSTARPGEVINYTINYANAGPGAASNVVLTDTLPAGTVLVDPSGGTVSSAGNVVTWNLGQLTAGSNGTRTIRLGVAPGAPGGTTITNTAQITATEAPAPVTGTAAGVQVVAPPQLLLTKTADRSTAHPGDPINYTLTVSNAGSGSATNVQLFDTLPAGTAYVSSPNGLLQGGTVIWNLGTIGPNSAATASLVVQVQPGAGSAGVINNVAQVQSTEIQSPVNSNNLAVNIIAPPQLQLSKSADRSTAQLGQTITYTITASNTGAGQATNVQIYDAIPTGTTYVANSAAPNGGIVGVGTLGWTISQLAAGASASVSFQVQVSANSGSITNVAQMRSTEVPTLISSNQGNPVVVTVVSPPQLQLRKDIIGSATVAPNGPINYRLSYSNVGGGSATSVTIQDTLPLNTTFASASDNGAQFGNTVYWNLGTIQAGQSGFVTLAVQVISGVANATQINNIAQISSAEVQNPVPSNTATVTVVAVPPPPILSVTKAADVASAPPGGLVNFTLTISNSGAGSATSVTVSDTIPAGMTGNFALDGGFINRGSFGSPDVAMWNLGTLGPGSSRQVRLQVQINSNASGTITNTAQVASNEVQTPSPSNSVSVTVNVPPNVSFQKVVDKQSAAPNESVRYVMTFLNNGPVTINNATITDTIPANTQVTATSQGVSPINGALTWNLPPIGPGQNGSVAFVVSVNQGTPDQTSINNQATFSIPAQQFAQNSNTVSTIVSVPPPPPNVAIQKSVDKASAMPNDTLSYTLAFRNNGAVALNGAVLTDAIPANTQFLGSQPNVNPVNGVLTWNLGTLNPGLTYQVTFQVRVNQGTPDQTPINNQASFNVPARQYGVNSNTVTTIVSVPPPPLNLAIQKSVNRTSAAPGDPVSYTISYQNNSGVVVNGATITDTIPANTQFSGASPNINPINGVLTWNLPQLSPGQSGFVSFQVSVNQGVPDQTPINNQAAINVAARQYAQNSNVVTTIITAPPPPPNVTVQKSVDKASAMPNDMLSYTIAFRNNGAVPLNGAVLTDAIPANTQFLGSQPNRSPVNGVLTWNLGTLNPGLTYQVTFQVRVNQGTPDQTPINNQASFNVPAQQYGVNSNTVTTIVSAPPPPLNLVVQKSVDKASAAPGDTLSYTLTYQNNSGVAVNGATITDTIPANTQFSGASPNINPINGVLTWNLPLVGAHQGGSVSFKVSVNQGTENQTPINNQAAINVPARQYVQNSNTVTTTVTAGPPPVALTLSKAVDKSQAAPVDTLKYTLTYANNGQHPSRQVQIVDPLPANVVFVDAANGGTFDGSAVHFALGDLAPGAQGSVSFHVAVKQHLANGTDIANQAQISGMDAPQPISSNTVHTTVGEAVTSFAGTWFTAPPGQRAASLTVDPQNKLTVWAVSQDRSSIISVAQGTLKPDGSFDVISTNQQVHFTGQIAADRQSASITANRPNVLQFTVTAPRVPDVVSDPLPANFVGTFNGFAVAANGDRIQVRISIDPGGNATFEADLIQVNPPTGRSLFAHYYVTADGLVTDPNGNRNVGMLQFSGNKLTLTYTYAAGNYQNTFQVPLQPF